MEPLFLDKLPNTSKGNEGKLSSCGGCSKSRDERGRTDDQSHVLDFFVRAEERNSGKKISGLSRPSSISEIARNENETR